MIPTPLARPSPPSLSTNYYYPLIADTGCTGHFLQQTVPVYNKTPSARPLLVNLPDGTTMASSHSAQIHLPNVPHTAGMAHIFSSLNTASLISIGQLCDHNCTAVFTKTKVEVNNANNNIVIQGQREPDGLWHLNLKNPTAHTTRQPNHSANLSTLAHQSTSDRIAFMHAAAGYPVLST
jgi:hypothetical protein